jgi:hypothetical protein
MTRLFFVCLLLLITYIDLRYGRTFKDDHYEPND